MTELALAEVPRIALAPDDAARALGVSRAFFFERIAPNVRCVRVGRKRLYRIAELERWAEANERGVLDHD